MNLYLREKEEKMPRILVVDDEPDICQLIRRYAEHDGYETVGDVEDGDAGSGWVLVVRGWCGCQGPGASADDGACGARWEKRMARTSCPSH